MNMTRRLAWTLVTGLLLSSLYGTYAGLVSPLLVVPQKTRTLSDTSNDFPSGPPPEQVDLVTAALRTELQCPNEPNPAPKLGRPSPIHGHLCDSMAAIAGDPGRFIGSWAREGAPLGMETDIPTCGIFPLS